MYIGPLGRASDFISPKPDIDNIARSPGRECEGLGRASPSRYLPGRGGRYHKGVEPIARAVPAEAAYSASLA